MLFYETICACDYLHEVLEREARYMGMGLTTLCIVYRTDCSQEGLSYCLQQLQKTHPNTHKHTHTQAAVLKHINIAACLWEELKLKPDTDTRLAQP